MPSALEKETKMVTNIAHRGARSVAPENTLMAGQRAIDIGADLWEVDVATTLDEKLILFHDPALDRTTNVRECFPDRSKEPFTTFTFDEIRMLDAGSWFVETDPFGQIGKGRLTEEDLSECRKQKVPSLEEILVLTRDAGFAVNLELKDLPAPMENFPLSGRVLSIVSYLGMGPDQIVFSSFNHDWLGQIQNRAPTFRVQALIRDPEDQSLNWGKEEFRIYNARHTLIADEKIKALKEKNIPVNLWTVNRENEMKRFITAGAAGIITDFPQRLKRLTEDV